MKMFVVSSHYFHSIPFINKVMGNDHFDAVINQIISFPPQWNANTTDFIRSVSGCSK